MSAPESVKALFTGIDFHFRWLVDLLVVCTIAWSVIVAGFLSLRRQGTVVDDSVGIFALMVAGLGLAVVISVFMLTLGVFIWRWATRRRLASYAVAPDYELGDILWDVARGAVFSVFILWVGA